MSKSINRTHSHPTAASGAAVDALVAAAELRLGHATEPREAFRSCLAQLTDLAHGPAWADGRDIVGEAYQRVVSAGARRGAGQFFTPLWVGRAMAHWLLSEPTSIVLDPGCGSGSLLIASSLERTDQSVRLIGLDSDPLAVEMANTTGSIRGIEAMEVRAGDFLLDPIAETPDGIICNPPFTRHHDVSPTVKAAIHEGFEERLGIRFSRLSSLHVLFLVRALEISSEDARLAFITPSHWLEMGYGREVKRFVLERASVEAIVRFPAEHLLFPGVSTTASITLFRKGAAPGLTRILECDGLSAATTFIASGLRGEATEQDLRLDAETSWTRRPVRRAKGIRLETLARVHRGVATGCNSFFVLSDARRKGLGLQRSSLLPCLASPKHFTWNQMRLADLEDLPDDVPRWLLAPTRERESGPLRRYLDAGRADLGVTDRYLVASRVKSGRRWFEVEVPDEAPILFSYFNRAKARFVRNSAEAVPLNSWLVIRPRPGVDPDDLFELLCSARVIDRLRDGARVYGRGLWKLEPTQLSEAWLPPEAMRLVDGR